jgi:hypothetical protein
MRDALRQRDYILCPALSKNALQPPNEVESGGKQRVVQGTVDLPWTASFVSPIAMLLRRQLGRV